MGPTVPRRAAVAGEAGPACPGTVAAGRRPARGTTRRVYRVGVVVRIGEAARASGTSTRALRYYEDEGLIEPGRCANGYRDYCRPTIDRIRAVRSLLAAGLPVRLVRVALADARSTAGRDAAPGGSGEFLAEVRDYRDRLAARIAELGAQQAALDAYLREAGRRGGARPSR